MRLRDDVKQCVVFIGTGGEEEFSALGTGFLVNYKRCTYLVTARHVAEDLGDCPFVVRMNHQDNESSLGLEFDPLEHAELYPWLTSNDTSIDLAVMQFNVDWHTHGGDARTIPETMFSSHDTHADTDFGVGDLCYAVGLFRLMSGHRRNLPFVHTGNIGLMPGPDRIPVQNWREGPEEPSTIFVEAYLAEMTSLDGLSGSPVFVRPCLDVTGMPLTKKMRVRLAQTDILLMGVWQSAWAGTPDQIIMASRSGLKVPVGIGAVVCISKLVEILEQPTAVEARDSYRARVAAAKAARPDQSSR